MGRAIRVGFLLLLGSFAASGHAGEILVHGKVVRVVPISAKSQVVEQSGDCESAKPAPDPDLVTLLAWDLRAECRMNSREVDVVTGYRVYYEWDGRVYDTVLTELPADTIPLRVTLN